MMIDISSASSKARAREKVRSLVVASHRKQEANQVSEREREDPIARQHRRARERETTATGARRDGARTEGRFAEASGLRSSRKSFLSGRRCTERELRVTPAGQQHARRDRGQHQHRTRYCVVCSCCEQPLHQELINLRGYRWL